MFQIPIRLFSALVPPLVMLTGCQAYVPAPLDPARDARAWHMRGASAEDLGRIADLLNAPATPDAKPQAGAAFSLTDGVSLEEAELVTLWFNPDARLARTAARAAAVQAGQAGRWENPAFSLELSRVLVNAVEPWTLGAGFDITIPLSGRLELEKEAAQAEVLLTEAEARQAEWEAVAALREAWTALAAGNGRVALLARHRTGVDALVQVMGRLADAGQVSRPEARAFEIASARVALELDQAEADRDAALLGVVAVMGLSPSAPVALDAHLVTEAPAAPLADLLPVALQRSPGITAAIAAHGVTEALLRVEVERQYPDLNLGALLAWEEGDTKAGLVPSLDVPLWNRNRENIARATGQRSTAIAAARAAVEHLGNRLAGAVQQRDAAARRLVLAGGTLEALATTQLAEVRRLAELGQVDPWLTLDALDASLDASLAVLDTRTASASAHNVIASLTGPGPGWPVLPPVPNDGEEK